MLRLVVNQCGAQDVALMTTNTLLAGLKASLDILLPTTITASGLDPLKRNFTKDFELAAKGLGPCRNTALHGSLEFFNFTGLASTRMDRMEATSAESNFFMTRVAAVTVETAVIGSGIVFEGRGEASASCHSGLLGKINIGQTELQTVSHVKGVSL